jgi:hypothetical protein
MSSVRVDATTGLPLECHLHLMRTAPCDDITRKDRSVVLDHNGILITVLHMHGHAIEVISILSKDEILSTFTRHRIDRQHDLICPLFDGNT